jgi:hypothetical protein
MTDAPTGGLNSVERQTIIDAFRIIGERLRAAVAKVIADGDPIASPTSPRAASSSAPTLLTSQKAAAMLRCSVATLDRLARQKVARPTRIGGLVRYSAAEIARLAKRRATRK